MRSGPGGSRKTRPTLQLLLLTVDRLQRFVRQLDLARLHVGRVVALAGTFSAGDSVGSLGAIEFAAVEARPRQERLAHDLFRQIVGRWRPDRAQLGRVIFDSIFVLGDGQDVARIKPLGRPALDLYVVDLDAVAAVLVA